MKTKYIVCSLSIFFAMACGVSFSKANIDYAKATKPTQIKNDFCYEYDYTKFASYSNDWKAKTFDSHFMTISPEMSCLGVGEQGNACDGEGYVVYKYDAPQLKAFATLEAHWIGRVFHNNDGGDCSKGLCSCGMDVLVSKDNIHYEVAGHEEPSIAGTTEFGFKHDLTEYARCASTIYVKLLLNGKNWDWVNMTSLKVYGTYCSALTNISAATSHNASNTRIKSNEEFLIDADITNYDYAEFNGFLRVIAPNSYFASNNSCAVNIDGESTAHVQIPLTLKQAGYTNYFIGLFDSSNNLIDRLPMTTFARGKGVYRFDTHSHSFISDGRNSLLDNYTQCHEKGLSGAISTDHDAPRPGDDSQATAATDILNAQIDEDFLAFRGSEVSSEHNFHILCTNFSDEQVVGTNSQKVIDNINNQGGFAYVAHPFLPNYQHKTMGGDPTKVDDLNNMMGLELYNAETSMIRGRERDFDQKNLEYWDRLNITGKKKFYGTSGSDAHDSIIIGAVSTAFVADDLTKEEILKSYANGKQYITTGPELTFNIDNKTYGESVYVRGNKDTTIHIEAYDPDFPIKKVVLYKFNINSTDVDTEFTNGRKNAQVLYEQGEDKINHFVYDQDITVEEGSFYRVEVLTESGSLEWSRPDYEGFAYGNPIFIQKEIVDVKMTCAPRKLTAEQYGTFNFDGVQILATFYDDFTDLVKNYYVTGQDTSKLGKVTVTFHFENYSMPVELEVVEQQGVVQVENGKISFYRDYSQYEAYSTNWQQDPAIDSIKGMLTITPSAKGLGIGKQSVQSYGTGFLTYRVEVPDGNVVNSLAMDVKGRIYHSMSSSKCSSGTCGCCYKVYTSFDGGCNFNLVYDFDISSGKSSWGQQFHIDLNEGIGESKCVLVKIEMTCQSWDWICMESVRLTGTYVEGQSIPVAEKGSVLIGGGSITYERDFTSLPQYSEAWKEDKALYATDGNLTISPSGQKCLCVGKQNVSSTGSGSVSYLVDLPENNVFDKLTYTCHGRIYHSNTSSACSSGTCTCAFKIFISVDGGYIFNQVYEQPLNFSDSKFNKTVSVDLAPYVQNRKSAIIKMYMSGRSWNWIGITDLAINGTYKTGTPVEDIIIEDKIDANYYEMGSGSLEWVNDAYSYNNVCIGKGDKPWFSINGDDGSFDKLGNVVYKLESQTGSFAEVNITGTARVFTYNGSDAEFRVLYSLDGENYNLLKEYTKTTNGGELTNIDLRLGEYLSGEGTVYIKIEMVSGFWDWVCMKDLHITGYSVSTYISLDLKDSDGNQVYSTNKYVKYTELNPEDYAKEGYVVEGFYTDQACQNRLSDLKLTNPENNIFIKYELEEYTITYANTQMYPTHYTIDSELKLSNPDAPVNKVFKGWYLNPDFEGEVITEIKKGTTGDMTLYAKFEEDPAFTEYKEDACLVVSTYVDSGDYRAAEIILLNSIIDEATTDIMACETKENVDLVVLRAKEAIDLLTTDAEYQLITAKEVACTSLDNYKDLSLYDSTDQIAILAAIDVAKTNINNATSIDEVTNALNAGKVVIDSFKTTAEKALIIAKENAVTEINSVYDSYLKNKYSESNKTIIDLLKENALSQINNATTITEIEITVNNFKTSIAAVPTLKGGCNGNILGASIVTIGVLGAITLLISKKKHNN